MRNAYTRSQVNISHVYRNTCRTRRERERERRGKVFRPSDFRVVLRGCFVFFTPSRFGRHPRQTMWRRIPIVCPRIVADRHSHSPLENAFRWAETEFRRPWSKRRNRLLLSGRHARDRLPETHTAPIARIYKFDRRVGPLSHNTRFFRGKQIYMYYVFVMFCHKFSGRSSII